MTVSWKVRLTVMFTRLDFIIAHSGCDVGDICAEAEKVVGWARNHHLGMSLFDPPTSNGKLMIPRDRLYTPLCEHFSSSCI